jgi:hypothetical protein
MTAFVKLPRLHWRDQFLMILPGIENHASYAFRHLDIESRTEAVADVIANAWVAFCRLVETGKSSLAYPSVLARYGVAQFNEGRRVGTSTNTRDVTSPAAQRKHGHRIESINTQDDDVDSWKSIAVEDRTTGPAEVAEFRIDFGDWLDSLPPKHGDMTSQMCEGRSTSELAEHHGVSRGRISQLRRELETSWREFCEVETVDSDCSDQELTAASVR